MPDMPPSATMTSAEVLRLLIAGQAAEALAGALELVAQSPQGADGRYWLSSALAANGDAAGAAQALTDGRTLHAVALMRQMGADVPAMSRSAEQASNVAVQLYGARYVATASVAYGMAIGAGEDRAEPLLSYALSLQHQGRAEEAIPVFRAVAELYPSPAASQFLLPPHFYVEDGVSRHAAEAKAWAEQHAPAMPEPGFGNPPAAGRRLRIGYVSPSFTQVQVRQFIQPVLDSHDRESVELFLYPARAEGEDGVGEGVTITPIGHLDDRTAADLMRGQGIDVLIDCWGHNAGSRLAMFAHRPAPVQAGWLNYQQTTGVPAIDYSLCADTVDAPGMAQAFTETIWRVGPTSAPFRPDGEPPLTQAPALRNRHVTFGAFINPAKLSDETVAAWAAILKGRPGARLILKYGYFVDPVLCAATAARFAGHGVDPQRIEYRGHTTGEAYVAEFGDVDLALDPSPTPGGTTSLEALSRSVPVLMRTGPTYYSRIGLQILYAAGLDELVAGDWDDYVARAIALTGDAAALDALRGRVREAFATAVYRDEVRVTRDLEAAYRGMFAAWEARRAAAA